MAMILLVDDDTSMRHFLGSALKRAGYKVVPCIDGREAMQELQKNGQAYDLLLTDIIMPGIDGIELSKKAAALHPDLKIMFMTGFSAVVMDRKELRDHLQVMSKPFHLKDLVSQVEKILAE